MKLLERKLSQLDSIESNLTICIFSLFIVFLLTYDNNIFFSRVEADIGTIVQQGNVDLVSCDSFNKIYNYYLIRVCLLKPVIIHLTL